jgi:hypothetical protein
VRRIGSDQEDWAVYSLEDGSSPWAAVGSTQPLQDRVQEIWIVSGQAGRHRLVTFTPERGVGMIRFFDGPNGLRLRERAYFETAIVGLPAGGGPDKLLLTLKWGWDENGRRYSPEPGVHPDKYEPLESLQVSDTFQAILQDNYPDYHLQ